jgi:hypothetical protein
MNEIERYELEESLLTIDIDLSSFLYFPKELDTLESIMSQNK